LYDELDKGDYRKIIIKPSRTEAHTQVTPKQLHSGGPEDIESFILNTSSEIAH